MVEDFIESSDPSKTLMLSDRLMINQCFYHFKHLYKDMSKKKGGGALTNGPNYGNASPTPNKIKDEAESKNQQEEVQRLQLLVQQRDNEIGILLNYLNKKKAPGEEIQGLPVQRVQQSIDTNTYSASREESKAGGGTLFQMMNSGQNQMKGASNYDVIQTGTNENPTMKKQQYLDREVQEVNQMMIQPVQCSAEDLADRTKSFELFRRSYRKNEAMEENRVLLKEQFGKGKELGNNVSNIRNLIKDLTNKIEQIRKENAMRGLLDANGEIVKTPEEDQIQGQINKYKMQYQVQYNELKELKAEIERIQNLLERSRERMQKDFESWLSVMIKQ